jgi:hypothetical protein
VIMNILREVRAAELLPFENVDSLESVAVRWRTLPTVAFRSINEGYTANEGDTEQVWESVYGFGGEIEFDRVFGLIKNTIVSMEQLQMDMKLTALALHFNDQLINGDHATDSKGFEGLKKRIASHPSRQSVYFAGSSSAALDATSSVANGRAFFDKLEEMHYKTNRGDVNALMMNEAMIYGIGKAARYIQASGGNFLDVTQDSFGRDITTYKGASCVDMGLKRDQSTEIITDSETAGDAGTDATSIYGVSFNTTQGLTGIQLEDLAVYDPLDGGERESKPTKLIRCDWWVGLAAFGSYGITRGRNVEGASNWT